MEEAFAIEFYADFGIWRPACHTVEVAYGLAAGEVALALDVDPHRSRLQEVEFEYCCDGYGIVQWRVVEAEDALVGGGEEVQEPGHDMANLTRHP